MIKAEELRIKNLVKCKVSNDAGIYEVNRIGGWIRIFASKEDERIFRQTVDEDIAQGKKYKPAIYKDEMLIRIQGGARDNEEYPESKIGGIKLTEEWLLKLGCEKGDMEYGGWLLPESDSEQIRIREDRLGFYYKPEQFANAIYFNCVHWLQNWYYFSTGQELTIKQ